MKMLSTRSFNFIILALSFFAYSSEAQADIVVLKNGQIIKDVITAEQGNAVNVKGKIGLISTTRVPFKQLSGQKIKN